MTPDRTTSAPPVAGVVVVAPAPELSVTVEHFDDRQEIHVHAGGQGFWVARMLDVLGVPTALVGSFGGETGTVARHLIEESGMEVVAVEVAAANGAYVHDRPDGERIEVGRQEASPLSRHELDDLYSAALSEGLTRRVAVLGGPNVDATAVPAATYERLARDLRTNGTLVVADLSGDPRTAALAGGVEVLKTSEEDLVADGLLDVAADVDAVLACMRDLAAEGEGAARVVVTRGGEAPALVLDEGRVWSAVAPEIEAVDPAGAGDSVTAGIAAGLAQDRRFEEAVRLGIAAATLNVARHGLASGDRDAIALVADRVRLDEIGDDAP